MKIEEIVNLRSATISLATIGGMAGAGLLKPYIQGMIDKAMAPKTPTGETPPPTAGFGDIKTTLVSNGGNLILFAGGVAIGYFANKQKNEPVQFVGYGTAGYGVVKMLESVLGLKQPILGIKGLGATNYKRSIPQARIHSLPQRGYQRSVNGLSGAGNELQLTPSKSANLMF